MTSTDTPSEELASSLSGEQIAGLLRAEGPVVDCVLLHAIKPTTSNTAPDSAPENVDAQGHDNNDQGGKKDQAQTNKDGAQSKNGDNGDNERPILKDLISQIKVDTTPKKSMVSQVLGGPFTFLGQYEEEGIVVMIRRDNNEGDANPEEGEANGTQLDDPSLVRNPHRLQPPLHDAAVYGDILLMRVAAVEDDDDEEETGDKECCNQEDSTGEENKKEEEDCRKSSSSSSRSAGEGDTANATIEKTDEELISEQPGTSDLKSNEDFFLNYTLEEYIKFASRTDILPKDEEEEEEDEIIETALDDEEGSESENEGDDDDDEDEDEDYEDDDSEDEDNQIGLMNLVLGQILKRFQEENGRGPDTHELLTMRSALAERLGIEGIAPPPPQAEESEEEEDSENNDDDDKKEKGNESKEGEDNDKSDLKVASSNVASVGEAKGDDDDEHDEKKASVAEMSSSSSSSSSLGKRKFDGRKKESHGKRVKFSGRDEVQLFQGDTLYIDDTEEIGDDEASI